MTKISSVEIQFPAGAWRDGDISPLAAIDPAKLAQRPFSEHAVSPSDLRVWDSAASLPPASPAADDLGLVTGTPGTNHPLLSTGDLKAAGLTTRKVAFLFVVPPNYDSGETIECRVRAGMQTTVADTSATVDLEVFASNLDGGSGSDLYSGAAQDVNSLTIADFDFAISPGTVNPGTVLMCVLSFSVNDAATATAVTGVVTDIRMRVDTRG